MLYVLGQTIRRGGLGLSLKVILTIISVCVHSKYPILGQKTFAYFSFAKQLLKKRKVRLRLLALYLCCSDLIEILSI